MALVYRVNINFSPLLNTFHCKCMMNITKFKSMSTSNTDIFGNSVRSTNFKDLIRNRKAQAYKSILIKLQRLQAINSITKLCSKYGTIVNVFPYSTINDQYFVLIEFDNHNTIKHLRKITPISNYENNHIIYITSPIFQSINRNNRTKDVPKEQVTDVFRFVIPDMKYITDVLKAEESISNQMVKLHNLVKVKELDIRLRFYTAEELTYYLSRLFRNLDIVPFGSSATGFGQTGCDLDLLCRISSIRSHAKKSDVICNFAKQIEIDSRSNQIAFLTLIHPLITSCVPGINNMRAILRARVPILKFTNYNTNMECDLSSANLSALHMSEMLYIYGILDHRVKPLVCTIRKWAEVKSITKTVVGTGITNFFLTVLVIFYLQVKGVLPSIDKIQCELKLNNSIQWKKAKWVPNNTDSLEKLLFEFFEFYRSFNFHTQAICIKDGTMKRKPDNSPIFIFNPFIQFLNISKNVSSTELIFLTKHFQNALHKLTTDNTQNGILRLFEKELDSPLDKIISNNLQKQSNSQSNDTKVLEKINNEDIEKMKNVITQ